MIKSTDRDIISQFHKLDISSLTLNQAYLNWDLVSVNTNIDWSKELINRFDGLLNWDYLISNKAINWKDPELLVLASEHGKTWDVFEKNTTMWTREDYYILKKEKRLSDEWILLQRIFLTQHLDWPLHEFIKEYDYFMEDHCGPYIDYDYDSYTGEVKETKMYHSLTLYEEYLKCLEKVFEKHWEKYSYSEHVFINALSEFAYNGSNEIVSEFYIKKNWEYLSKSIILPWSKDLISKFSSSWHWRNLLRNDAIAWTKELIELFFNHIDNFSWENDYDEIIEINAWDGLLLNSKLKIDLNYFSDKRIHLNWKYLSLNKGIQFSRDFLDYLHDELFVSISNGSSFELNNLRKVFFGNLHKNLEVKWTYEIFEKYKHLLNWNDSVSYWRNRRWETKKLSQIDSIYYSRDFINRFSDVLDFKFLSSFQYVEWSNELINKYKDLWDWELLKNNRAIEWSKYSEN